MGNCELDEVTHFNMSEREYILYLIGLENAKDPEIFDNYFREYCKNYFSMFQFCSHCAKPDSILDQHTCCTGCEALASKIKR